MVAQYSSDDFNENMLHTLRNAVSKALLYHQAVGNKTAFWDNGKIVLKVPSNIQVDKPKKISDTTK